MRTAYFDRFTLRMSLRDALDVSTPGQDATEACEDLIRDNPYIDAQLAAIDDQTLVDAAIYGGEVRCYEDYSVCWLGGDWHTDATIAIHLDNSWRE